MTWRRGVAADDESGRALSGDTLLSILTFAADGIILNVFRLRLNTDDVSLLGGAGRAMAVEFFQRK
jgi:hypothetical protein